MIAFVEMNSCVHLLWNRYGNPRELEPDEEENSDNSVESREHTSYNRKNLKYIINKNWQKV